jgi:hypothetical protein
MRGLLIRQPYIDMILDGLKIWEMRGRRCSFREKIALIQSGTNTVVGIADISDCLGPLSDKERLAAADRHCVSPDEWLNPQFADYRFVWVLSNAKRLSKPISYHHPNGAVIWVTLDDSVSQQIVPFVGNLDKLMPAPRKEISQATPLSINQQNYLSVPTASMSSKAIPANQIEPKVPFAKDGSYFHPLLRKPRTGEFTVGEKGFEMTFDSFDDALQYLRSMPVAKWRRPNDASNWGLVAAVHWGPMPSSGN